jgi:hypothetical protein
MSEARVAKERRAGTRINCMLEVGYRALSTIQHQALLPVYQDLPTRMRIVSAPAASPRQPAPADAITKDQLVILLLAELNQKMDSLLKLQRPEQPPGQSPLHTLPEKANCISLSELGMKMLSYTRASPGDLFDLVLHLPAAPPTAIRVLARVARDIAPAAKFFDTPLVFTALHKEDLEHLARFIFQCQRQAQASSPRAPAT